LKTSIEAAVSKIALARVCRLTEECWKMAAASDAERWAGDEEKPRRV
jgi:hypothetical protein